MIPAEGDAFLISPTNPNSLFVNAAQNPRNPGSDSVLPRHSSVCSSHGSISVRLCAMISVSRLIANHPTTPEAFFAKPYIRNPDLKPVIGKLLTPNPKPALSDDVCDEALAKL